MPGDILIRQLEYLAALAREQHFGRAAAACHVSQPALSAAIRKLETALGATIIQRGHRFAGLTSEGQRVLGWAHRILAERDDLRIDLDRLRHGLTATVRIGAIPTAVPATPLLTTALAGAHPLARVRIEALSSRAIARKLHDFEVDVGFTYLDEETDPARKQTLYHEHYLLLTANDQLTGLDSVDWATAARQPLCVLDNSMRNRRILDAAVAAAGSRLEPVVEADTVDALYAHVSSGACSSIVAHAWLHALGVPRGVRAVPLQDPSPHPAVGLVTGARETSTIGANALLDAVRTVDIATTLDHAVDAVRSRIP